MSDSTGGRRWARWFLLPALAAAWLGLARSDHSVVPASGFGSISVALLQPDGRPGPVVMQLPSPLPSPLQVAVVLGPSISPVQRPTPPAPQPAPPAGPALCSAAATDPTVIFARDDLRQLLAVEFHNRGDTPCRLDPDIRISTSNFADQRADLQIPSCYQCGTAAPAMKPAILDPGQTIAVDLAWPVEAAAAAGSCRDADSLRVGIDDQDRATPGPNFDLRLNSRKLRLCPPIDYGPYRSVELVSPPGPVRLVLSADRPDYYPDEIMQLHLVAQDSGHALAQSLKSCRDLSLLTKLRRPDGEAEFTMVAVTRQASLPLRFGGAAPRFWQQELMPSATENFPGEMSYFVGTGLAADHAASYVSTCGAWATIARSADLETHVVDGPPAPPSWGEPIDGFALALATDRDRYTLGQDIPLRIICTRFTQDWAVRGSMEVPLCPVTLSAVDEAGIIVPSSGMDLSFFLPGHNRHGTRHVEGGAVIEQQSSLVTKGNLPPRPGLYRITATWLAPDDGDPGKEPIPVRSLPLMLTIVDPAP